MMWLILSDIGSWGYTAGAVRYYAVLGFDGITYYVVEDGRPFAYGCRAPGKVKKEVLR